MRTDEEVSAQNPPEDAGDASSAHHPDRRLSLLLLFLVIAVYAVIGYAVYKVMDGLV